MEKENDLDLRACLQLAQDGYPDGVIADGTTGEVFDYMVERFHAWYEEEDIPVEVFRAVSACQLGRPLDIHHRVLAVHAFTQLPESQALAAANKRVSNILGKLEDGHEFGRVSTDLLVEPQEISLSEQLEALSAEAKALLEKRAYREALAVLAGLRDAVDAFFDGVMVNTDDEKLRDNRLNLLKSLRDLFLQIADISQLAVSK